MELYFTHGFYLFLLFLIPAMIFLHLVSIQSSRKNALRFANFEAISRIKGIEIFSKNITLLILSSIIVLLVVFSLSGMTVKVSKTVSDFSFVFAIDTSQSMEAKDFEPNRLEAAKLIVSNFVELLPFGSRSGVVSFSGSAIVEHELTDDKFLLKESLKNIVITSIGGTDISDAIVTSINLLSKEDSKAIVLLSDGQVNVGFLDEAIKYANKNNVVIHTVGIGTVAGGETSYGYSKLDEDALKSLSYATSGTYFEANSKDELEKSFLEIANFKKKDVLVDLSNYLLVIALIIFMIEFILFNFKYRGFP